MLGNPQDYIKYREFLVLVNKINKETGLSISLNSDLLQLNDTNKTVEELKYQFYFKLGDDLYIVILKDALLHPLFAGVKDRAAATSWFLSNTSTGLENLIETVYTGLEECDLKYKLNRYYIFKKNLVNDETSNYLTKFYSKATVSVENLRNVINSSLFSPEEKLKLQEILADYSGAEVLEKGLTLANLEDSCLFSFKGSFLLPITNLQGYHNYYKFVDSTSFSETKKRVLKVISLAYYRIFSSQKDTSPPYNLDAI